MKTIELSRGMVSVVDDEDFLRVSQFKWTFGKSTRNKTGYAYRNIYGAGNKRAVRRVQLHRFVVNALNGDEVDHRDGDGLNNQRHNLRVCTHAENMRNMRMHNSHGFKGVATTGNKTNPWRACICINGRTKHIGNYPSVLDAAIAYNEMAAKHFGEFARLNPV